MSKLTWIQDGDNWLGYESDDGQKPVVKIECTKYHRPITDDSYKLHPFNLIQVFTNFGEIKGFGVDGIDSVAEAKAYCEERFNKEWWKNE